MKNKILTTLLLLHLSMIFLGTGLVDFSKVPSGLHGPIAWYLAISGGHPYNFFSPDIPTQVIVRCYITDTNGLETMETFGETKNTYELRTNYLFQLLDNVGDPETAAKIAAHACFKRHAGARSVRVSIGRFVVPSVKDYKRGEKSSISEFYTQTFAHE